MKSLWWCVCKGEDLSVHQQKLYPLHGDLLHVQGPRHIFEVQEKLVTGVCAGERMYAHGGIVAAAASILADMELHHLLRRLLEEYDPFAQQHLQPDTSAFRSPPTTAIFALFLSLSLLIFGSPSLSWL